MLWFGVFLATISFLWSGKKRRYFDVQTSGGVTHPSHTANTPTQTQAHLLLPLKGGIYPREEQECLGKHKTFAG